MRDLNARAHSNETLRVVRAEGVSCVLKTYSTHLDRARKNIDKQRSFRPIKNSSVDIEAVPIAQFKQSELSIQIRMPYIEGYSGEDFAVYGTIDMARKLSSALSEILLAEFKVSNNVCVEKKIFSNKFREIQELIDKPEIKIFCNSLKKILDHAPMQIAVPVGACHGDLTFGNLIYHRDSKIFLIDFLHTYLESPLQDVAKLNQEFKYYWSFRKCSDSLNLKGRIFLDSTFPKILKEISQRYSLQNSIFEMLNLLRIAPYVKDDLTFSWLITSLQKFKDENGL